MIIYKPIKQILEFYQYHMYNGLTSEIFNLILRIFYRC